MSRAPETCSSLPNDRLQSSTSGKGQLPSQPARGVSQDGSGCSFRWASRGASFECGQFGEVEKWLLFYCCSLPDRLLRLEVAVAISLQLSFDYRLFNSFHLCVARSGLDLRSFSRLWAIEQSAGRTSFDEKLDPGGATSPGLASILAGTLLVEQHPSDPSHGLVRASANPALLGWPMTFWAIKEPSAPRLYTKHHIGREAEHMQKFDPAAQKPQYARQEEVRRIPQAASDNDQFEMVPP